jgi:hypothetical protein
MAFTDRYAAPNAVPSAVNQLSLYAMQGGATYCDGTSYDGLGFTPPSGSCGSPDGANNLHVVKIAPNSFSGQFQLQVRADNIAMMAVPFADGYGVNQDFALWVYNAY